MGATITDATALTVSDYRLQYEDAPAPAYKLTRLSDGQVTAFAPAGAGGMLADGVNFSVQGTPVNGDAFLVQPTAAGGRDISMAIGSPGNIAASGATSAAPGARNTGTGVIALPAVQ